ncbi:MAG: hypothetical protein ACRDHZ_23045, partial [Ktedonobacteraceae bacterium]
MGNTNVPLHGNPWNEPQQQQFGASGAWSQPAASDNERNVVSGQLVFPPSPWQNSSNAAQQIAFSTTAQQQGGNSLWSQTLAPDEAGQSLLPVPYQGPPTAQGLMVMPNGFPTFNQNINPLLPALPDAGQEAPLYVAPMYTKPRPLISRYRAISGLLSMLIVCGLLCTGAGYYAQVTGKLVFFEKLFGTYAPPTITTGAGFLTVPSLQQTVVPNSVITSAAISNSQNTDTHNGIIANEVNQFHVNDAIYLICNFPPAQGSVTVKWYNGNNLYHIDQRATNSKSTEVIFEFAYALSVEGKAEIYWNNQLQITLFFVVEP